MGIRTDDHVTRHRQTLLRKQCMLDAHLTHFKIIGDLILFRKLADTLAVFRRLDILIGYKVIRHQRNLVLVKHAVHLHFVHFLDCNRAGDVIAKHQIQIRLD